MYGDILLSYLASPSLQSFSPIFAEVDKIKESLLTENSKVRTTGQRVDHGLHPAEPPPQSLRPAAIPRLLGKLVWIPHAQEHNWPETVCGDSR